MAVSCHYDSGFNIRYIEASLNNRQVLRIINDYQPGEFDPSCLMFFFDVEEFDNYANCLGHVYHYKFNLPTTCTEHLAYFKKGNEEWGSPINFDILLNDVEAVSEPVQAPQIYPNPANREIIVELDTNAPPVMRWELYDLHGVLRKQGEPDAAGMRVWSVPVADLPGGLYGLRLVYEGGHRGAFWVLVFR